MALAISRVVSTTYHGSRYVNPDGFEGVLKKKDRNELIGAMLGMLQGKSMTANWTEYRFVLTPSTAALKPSTLEYFEITAPPIGVEETNPEQQISAEEDTSPEPHSVLLVDYRSTIEEEPRSSSGQAKFLITGTNTEGEAVTWNLKVASDEDYKSWLRCLRKANKAKWETNKTRCSLCDAQLRLLKPAHHCRRCGRCVCEACSPGGRVLDAEGLVPVRVCDPCNSEMGPNEDMLGM
mmetsp:Transcript_12188/g.20694  ORF Transcript_12188/g.20694 Transcript_12188/m.20694 type:complete len:236 (+) Transcript_12188:61-768(+)